MPVRLHAQEERAPARHGIGAVEAEPEVPVRAASETLLSPGLDPVVGVLLGAAPFALYISGGFVSAMRHWGVYAALLVLVAVVFGFFMPLRDFTRLRNAVATTAAVWMIPIALACLIACTLIALAMSGLGPPWLRDLGVRGPGLTTLAVVLPVAATGVVAGLLSVVLLRTAFRRSES